MPWSRTHSLLGCPHQALLPGLFSFALEDRTQCLETGAVRRRFCGGRKRATHQAPALLKLAACRLINNRPACRGAFGAAADRMRPSPLLHALQVSYKQATTTQLALHIPLEAAVNAAAVEQYKERQVRWRLARRI